MSDGCVCVLVGFYLLCVVVDCVLFIFTLIFTCFDCVCCLLFVGLLLSFVGLCFVVFVLYVLICLLVVSCSGTCLSCCLLFGFACWFDFWLPVCF